MTKPYSTQWLLLVASLILNSQVSAQNFFFGTDLSYVNEMQDCGVVYKENGAPKDPYAIFADNGCNLVRLRLWHTPSFYDTLNSGKRYADFQDVRKSIQRAKAAGMKVLLDFQLSDFWADPSRQLCPVAWLGVVNNLPVLKDSLYQYVHSTLMRLNAEGLMPEMVQIGNETNRGIMLSPAVNNAGWSLDWPRNSQLFNTAIEAVRDAEDASGKNILVSLHIAGPAELGWLMQGFWNNGVRDFDIIGMSYYWAWHMPTSIANTGNFIAQMRQQYPGKAVMVLETAYIWTTQSNDNANNIISQVHPSYAPASPENQRRWLQDLTQEVINQGGLGVVYWEPAWVSSPCRTPWGTGSHQEHATFFDFQNNLLSDGGVKWMTYPYDNLVAIEEPEAAVPFTLSLDSSQRLLEIKAWGLSSRNNCIVQLLHVDGRRLQQATAVPDNNAQILLNMTLPDLPVGIYYAVLRQGNTVLGAKGFRVAQP